MHDQAQTTGVTKRIGKVNNLELVYLGLLMLYAKTLGYHLRVRIVQYNQYSFQLFSNGTTYD